MLIGTLFSSEQQAGPIGMIVGLTFAAIGGSMAPLDTFPSTMRTIAHVTPHAWANDAFNHLLERQRRPFARVSGRCRSLRLRGGVAHLATWRLRRVLTA